MTETGHASIGRDAAAHGDEASGVAVTDDFNDECDVAIEFSTPAGCAHWARWCGERGIPIVSGTTGLDDGAGRRYEWLRCSVGIHGSRGSGADRFADGHDRCGCFAVATGTSGWNYYPQSTAL